MIIEALARYYDIMLEKGEVPKEAYSSVKVAYALNLSADGRLTNIIPLKNKQDDNGKLKEVPIDMIVPEQSGRSSGVCAYFLCDNSKYTLGIEKNANEKTLTCFNAYKTLLLEVLKDCQGEAATALKLFYTHYEPGNTLFDDRLQEMLDEVKADTGNLIWRVEHLATYDDPEIKQAWERYYANKNFDTIGFCSITGRKAPLAKKHIQIRGIAGAQISGASLVSFNDTAYESYGKEKGQNAPISLSAANAYAKVLNYMLSSKGNNHHQRIGETTLVFWAEDKNDIYEDIFLAEFDDNALDAQELKAIVEQLVQGKAINEINSSTPFYCLGLSPNNARLSVRFFVKDSFGKIITRLYQHQERLLIKNSYGEANYIGLWRLLNGSVHQKASDKKPSPLMAGAMMRSILLGLPYPESFYQGILLRIKADRTINDVQAAAIKAYLLRNHQQYKEVIKVALNEDNSDKAYVLGRLFAVLERAQNEALPGLNRTITDSYLTSACATPGTVFPQLLKLNNYHNSKNDYGSFRRQEIEALLSQLNADEEPFPAHFSLKEQGVFLLGYYQQRAKRYEKKETTTNG